MTGGPSFKSLAIQIESYISEIEQCLEFTKTSIESRPQLTNIVAWERITPTQRELVQRFLSYSDIRPELVFRSLYVSAHAFFESLIREIASKTIDFISEVSTRESLSDSILNENIYRSGQALVTVKNPLVQHNFNYGDIAKNVSRTCEDDADVFLNSDAMTMSIGNITAENIDNLFRRVAIPIGWDAISNDRDLMKLHGVKRVRDSANATKQVLSDMVTNRNRIAHEGAHASDVTLPDLEFQLKFIRIFSLIFLAHIEKNAKLVYR